MEAIPDPSDTLDPEVAGHSVGVCQFQDDVGFHSRHH